MSYQDTVYVLGCAVEDRLRELPTRQYSDLEIRDQNLSKMARKLMRFPPAETSRPPSSYRIANQMQAATGTPIEVRMKLRGILSRKNLKWSSPSIQPI